MKHTPGPWEYEVTNETPNRLDIIIQASIGGKDIGWNYVIPDGEGEANARLIAAAPEMLEMIVEIYRGFKAAIDTTGYTPPKVNQIIVDLIEKATGMTIDEVLK